MIFSQFKFNKLASFGHVSSAKVDVINSQVGAFDEQIEFQNSIVTTDTLQLFNGGCLLPDGDVLMAPAHSGFVSSYNPATNVYTELLEHNLSDVKLFDGAVLLDEREALFVPSRSNDVGVFNYLNNTLDMIDTGDTIDLKYSGGTLTKDRSKVIFAPYDSATIGIYNVASRTFSNGLAHGLGSGAFNDCKLLPNGNIFMCASSSATHIIYNPDTNSIVDTFTSDFNNYSYGLVPLTNGDIVLVPSRGSNVLTYSFRLNKILLGPEVESHSTTLYRAGALMQDGRVIFSPSSGAFAGVFNPKLNSYEKTITDLDTANPNSEKFQGAVTTKNGVVLIPALNRAFYKIKPLDVVNSFDVASIASQFI